MRKLTARECAILIQLRYISSEEFSISDWYQSLMPLPDKIEKITPTLLKKSLPKPLRDYINDRIFPYLRALESDIEFIATDGVYLAQSEDLAWHVPIRDPNEVNWCVTMLDRVTRFMEYIEPEDTILEVGAATGEYTVAAADAIGPDGKMFAIEAEPHNFTCLKKNLELKNKPNVKPYQRAMSDTEGKELDFAVRKYASSIDHGVVDTFKRWGTLAEHRYDYYTLETETIDNFCDEKGIDDIDILKVTVNGHEPQILAGARQTLGNVHYVVLHIEYPEAHAILSEHGFKIVERRDENPKHLPKGPVLYERSSE